MGDALLWMLIGHALADYPLQGDWLSKAKNHTIAEIQGPPTFRGGPIWPGALLSHAAIHAGAVRLATGSWLLAGCEFAAHALIDHAKCSGRLTYNQDQALHIACKLVWFGLLLAFGPLS